MYLECCCFVSLKKIKGKNTLSSLLGKVILISVQGQVEGTGMVPDIVFEYF